MRHGDWLYLIEFHTRNGNLKAAEEAVAAMKMDKQLGQESKEFDEKMRRRIEEAGFTSQYF